MMSRLHTMETVDTPLVLVDTVPRKLKKQTKTSVDDSFFVKKGMLPIPAKTDESLYLRVASLDDVPQAWRDEIASCNNSSAQQTKNQREKEKILKRYGVGTHGMNWRTLHLIVYLVRAYRSSTSHKTFGRIDPITDCDAPHQIKLTNWVAKPEYGKLVDKVEAITTEQRSMIDMTDGFMRQKRARTDPSRTITTKEGRSFCFVDFTNDKGFNQYAWIEVTPFTVIVPLLVEGGYVCCIEGCKVNNDLLKCSRCKNVFYCSVLHQKADWPSHKLICCK